jgi:hypothetical protein
MNNMSDVLTAISATGSMKQLSIDVTRPAFDASGMVYAQK